jgi:hypothetical protein
VIALAGYELVEFVRSRRWIPLVAEYLVFAVGLYLRSARHGSAAWVPSAVGTLVFGVGLGATVCLVQDPARWQITVVAAGGPERAQLSRVVVAMVLLLPAALLAALVVGGGDLFGDGPVAGLLAGLLLCLVTGLFGSVLGTWAGRRRSAVAAVPVAVFTGLGLLVVLAAA